jgi:diaminopimelate epimerase
MKINFTKIQSCGNDYIYVNCLKGIEFDPSGLALRMSPRHLSVGSDGVILACPSDVADFKMRIFNADGSEAKMCGNGIRGLAAFLADEGLVSASTGTLKIESNSGIHTVYYNSDGSISAEMVKHSFEPTDIPMKRRTPLRGDSILVNGIEYKSYAVSLGNPHLVLFVDNVNIFELEDNAKPINESWLFPDGINVEIVSVSTDKRINMRVYERGSGETYSCGTGACAVALSLIEEGIAESDNVVIHTRGGILRCSMSASGRMILTGNSQIVYKGIYEYNY